VSYELRPVTVSAFVPAPPDQLFAYVSDTRNDPKWCPNVTGVEQVSGDGVGVGSRFRFHQSIEVQGRTLDSEVEVEVLSIADHAIEWAVDDRFQSRHVRLGVEPVEGGSKVTQRTTATFKRKPGIARWAYPFLARRTFRKQFTELAGVFGQRTPPPDP
jgi:hypothetical protein